MEGSSFVGHATEYTIGSYENENESAQAFDSKIEESKLFRTVYKEVRGQFVQPRIITKYEEDKEEKKAATLRIDRIIVPGPSLWDKGCEIGPIGVEIKRSGMKLGPVLAQVMDYSKAAFKLPRNGAFGRLMPEWYFIWPLGKCHGVTASVMSQNRIGGICVSKTYEGERLEFHVGELMIIQYYFETGKIKFNTRNQGDNTGSR